MSVRSSAMTRSWLAYLLLILGLVLQVGQHAFTPATQVRVETLPAVVPAPWLRVMSLGEPVVLAKVLMLWLQAYDYQAGVDLTWKDRNLQRLEGWLGVLLELDPHSQYPLMAAVRYYGNVPDPEQQRRFAAFAYRQFFVDPQQRWPWLAHAAIMSKHRLKDLPLALQYARAIRIHATGSHVPSWAKQMEIVMLEEMGAWQSARLLVQTLLQGGTVKDPREIHFLKKRLQFLNRCAAQTCKGESYESLHNSELYP